MASVPKNPHRDISVLEDTRVDPTGVADSTAGILNIIQIAEGLDYPSPVAYPPGEYRVTGTIKHLGPVNAHPQAILLVDHDGIGLQFSEQANQVTRVQARLPSVRKVNRLWSAATGPGSDWGVVIDSAQACEIHIPESQNFSKGALFTGQRTVHNTVTLGRLTSNKINLQLTPAPVSGWVNQNLFISGRLLHYSNDGVEVPGVRNVSLDMEFGFDPLDYSAPNGNTFINVSFENAGPAVEQLYCVGSYNQFINPRWERGAGQKLAVFDGERARHNVIQGGFGGINLDIRQLNGAVYNSYNNEKLIMHEGDREGILRITNGNSVNAPAIRIFTPVTDPHDEATRSIEWTCQITGRQYEGKSRTDTVPQIIIDNNNGRLGMIDTGGTMRWLQQPTGPGPANWV